MIFNFNKKDPRPNFGFNPDRSNEYSDTAHTAENSRSYKNEYEQEREQGNGQNREYRNESQRGSEDRREPRQDNDDRSGQRRGREGMTEERRSNQENRDDRRSAPDDNSGHAPSSGGNSSRTDSSSNSSGNSSGKSSGNSSGSNSGANNSGSNHFEAKKRPSSQRTFTLTLTLSKCVGYFIALSLIVVWAFILGILLGRGFEPEAHIPELERIMPPPQRTAGQPNGSYSNASVPNKTPRQDIIPEEDLSSRQSLKGSSNPKPAAAKQPAASTKQDTAGQSPSPSSPSSAPASTQGQTAAQENALANPVSSSEEVFTYVYQVAASKNEPAAKAMATRLGADKHDASVESFENNGVTWYRVLITFHGTPEDTDILRQKLSVYNIDRLLLRSKVPLQR